MRLLELVTQIYNFFLQGSEFSPAHYGAMGSDNAIAYITVSTALRECANNFSAILHHC